MRFDLHIHSQFSPDSHSPVEAILKRAREVGLDGLAITDHNSLQSFPVASEVVDDLGLDLTIIPGAEITTAEGHLLALGISNLPPSGLPAVDTIKCAQNDGGIAIAPHPFAFFRQGIRNLKVKRPDAVETFNSRYLVGFSNYLAARAAHNLGLGITGGSDSHKIETVGYGYTEVVADSTDVKQILLAIRERHTHAYGRASPRLRMVGYSLSLRIGNQRNSR